MSNRSRVPLQLVPDISLRPCSYNGTLVASVGWEHASDVFPACLLLCSYNGTLMAYGQTGAGKTYSLSSIAADAIGMIPRAAAEIFSHIEQVPSCCSWLLLSNPKIGVAADAVLAGRQA